VLALEAKGCGLEDLLPLISGKRVKEAWETGNVDLAPMMMGQSVGLVHDIPTCRDLIERMVGDAKKEISRVAGLL